LNCVFDLYLDHFLNGEVPAPKTDPRIVDSH
jgi:hypothetical protein